MLFVPKKWGHEIWIENNELYCGKHLHLIPGHSCSVHFHKNKKETFYIIDGTLELQHSDILDKKFWEDKLYSTIVLNKGDSFTISPYVAHRFFTHTQHSCDFIEISTYHEDSDSYRIIESI